MSSCNATLAMAINRILVEFTIICTVTIGSIATRLHKELNTK